MDVIKHVGLCRAPFLRSGRLNLFIKIIQGVRLWLSKHEAEAASFIHDLMFYF